MSAKKQRPEQLTGKCFWQRRSRFQVPRGGVGSTQLAGGRQVDRGEPAVTLEMASSQAHGRSPGAACMALPVSLVPCPSGDRLRVGGQDAATGSCEAGAALGQHLPVQCSQRLVLGTDQDLGRALSHPVLLWW